ncbi:TIR domain-containing protein [Escherichia coli]
MGSCAAPSAKGDDKFITTDYLQQCPRQNVVLEHGWLMSKLSRKFVAAIVEDGVEFPGDLSGVVRISASDWKYDLSKELKVLNN